MPTSRLAERVAPVDSKRLGGRRSSAAGLQVVGSRDRGRVLRGECHRGSSEHCDEDEQRERECPTPHEIPPARTFSDATRKGRPQASELDFGGRPGVAAGGVPASRSRSPTTLQTASRSATSINVGQPKAMPLRPCEKCHRLPGDGESAKGDWRSIYFDTSGEAMTLCPECAACDLHES